jgi:hypothetical protein
MINNPVLQWIQTIGRRAKHARSNHHRHQLESECTTHRHRKQVEARESRTAGDPTVIDRDYSRDDRKEDQKGRGRGTPTRQVVDAHPKAGNCSGTACTSRDKGGRGGEAGGCSRNWGGWSPGVGREQEGNCWGKRGWGWGIGWGKQGWGWGSSWGLSGRGWDRGRGCWMVGCRLRGWDKNNSSWGVERSNWGEGKFNWETADSYGNRKGSSWTKRSYSWANTLWVARSRKVTTQKNTKYWKKENTRWKQHKRYQTKYKKRKKKQKQKEQKKGKKNTHIHIQNKKDRNKK